MKTIFAGENRTCENVKTFFFSSLTSAEENRRSEDVKTFFLLFTDIFRGKHELSVDTQKNFAFDFSRFWHADQKRLPIPGLSYMNQKTDCDTESPSALATT